MRLAQEIIELASEKGVMLGTAESCTGGMIAAALTDIAGSSAAVDRGFVTYSNEAKAETLGVDPAIITKHGAVSRDVVEAMAKGAAAALKPAAHGLAVSVSGVAGPGGGSAEKPVGMVWFGRAHRAGDHITVTSHLMQFDGDRAAIRQDATAYALTLLHETLKSL